MERKNDGIFGKLGLDEDLKGETKMSPSFEAKEKSEILKKARNTTILSLSDHFLRKVIKAKTAAEALPNRIYLKQKFYGFKMEVSKPIDENIEKFTNLVTDLENLDVKIDEEDQTIFSLNSLPKQYDQVVPFFASSIPKTLVSLISFSLVVPFYDSKRGDFLAILGLKSLSPSIFILFSE